VIVDKCVEVEHRCTSDGGSLAIRDVQGKTEGVEHPENEPKLSGRFACLELVDPLARHTGTHGKLGLAETEVSAAAADDGSEVSDRTDVHGLA
jgi:hypothetical protein